MKTKFQNKWVLGGMAVLLFFLLLQLCTPSIYFSEKQVSINAPKPIENILDNSCYACHSNTNKLSWYDKIAPASFFVANHIKEAREVLNFSDWDSLTSAQQKGKLYYSLNKILEGEMPLASYSAVHTNAKLSANNITQLKQYVAGLSPRKGVDSVAKARAIKQYTNWQKGAQHAMANTVKPTLNGIQYIDDYAGWKAISTTDRVDNGTMRVIFANDVAVKAIESEAINPWPNGSVFAKVAWKEQVDNMGNITPGEFYQVEFMIKDDDKYTDTKGWGWARWRGLDLEPYGANKDFTNECIKCHQPLKDDDYVFTAPLLFNRD